MNTASSRGSEIRSALQVNPNLKETAELKQEIERRIEFIKNTVRSSGTRALVLGISGATPETLDRLAPWQLAALAHHLVQRGRTHALGEWAQGTAVDREQVAAFIGRGGPGAWHGVGSGRETAAHDSKTRSRGARTRAQRAATPSS